ncbi:antitoxin [Corynebacterium hylobatis]|uniref:Antitoxin n=2 Tax=Corynebacterium hylobatis TaxID=1859290 RepID=A0A3R9ZJC8_9CORY|nr:antitoxin [Corynebacterium hylobatis]
MGFMDKAKGKAGEFLKDEGKTDALLDKAEEQATRRLGEDKAGHISGIRDAADKRVGSGDDNRADAEAGDDPQADPGPSA